MTERAYLVVQICYAAHDKERNWKNFSIQDETNKVRTYRNGKLLEVPHFAVGVVFGLVPAGKDRPLVFVTLVVVASYLLLVGTHRVSLNV